MPQAASCGTTTSTNSGGAFGVGSICLLLFRTQLGPGAKWGACWNKLPAISINPTECKQCWCCWCNSWDDTKPVSSAIWHFLGLKICHGKFLWCSLHCTNEPEANWLQSSNCLDWCKAAVGNHNTVGVGPWLHKVAQYIAAMKLPVDNNQPQC